MKSYRDLISYFIDGPNNGKVDAPHQEPIPKSPPTLGHASFKPYLEPILKTKNWREDGPLYFPFEKSFSPMDIKIKIFNEAAGEMEEQRIITPTNASSRSLFNQPSSELDDLLPDGAQRKDFLPAIRWAIQLTIWKKAAVRSLKEKCHAAWAKWKNRNQKPSTTQRNWEEDLFNNKCNVEDPAAPWNQIDGGSAWESLQASIKARRIQDGMGRTSRGSFEDEDENEWEEITGDPPFKGELFYPEVDDLLTEGLRGALPLTCAKSLTNSSPLTAAEFNVAREEITSAYNALKSVLDDYYNYGLLHYRPLGDANRSWAQNNGFTSEIFLKVKEAIDRWSQVYCMYTYPRLQDVPGWVSGFGDILRSNASLHRQMQSLPSCLLYKMPLFPDLTTINNKKDGIVLITKAVKDAADFLGNVLEEYLRKIDSSQPENKVIEEVRARISRVLGKEGSGLHGPYPGPGPVKCTPVFLMDDLRKLPGYLIKRLPTIDSDGTYSGNDFINAVAVTYRDNLLQAEDIISNIVQFPEDASVEK